MSRDNFTELKAMVSSPPFCDCAINSIRPPGNSKNPKTNPKIAGNRKEICIDIKAFEKLDYKIQFLLGVNVYLWVWQIS